MTDANLVLGRLNPQYFLGGELKLEVDTARAALARIGNQLGMSVEEVAIQRSWIWSTSAWSTPYA